MFKHNRPRYIRLSKGRKSCGKSKKCFLCGKGFHCSVFSNLSEFNTLMGSYQRQRSRSTAGIKRHVREWKTFDKERAEKRLERERDMVKKYLWTIDQNIKMGFFKYSSCIITFLSLLKSK